METEVFNNNSEASFLEEPFATVTISTDKPFIQANTVEGRLEEIRDQHIIPVFIKDNEPVISHHEFIQCTFDIVSSVYGSEAILKPNIRLSHPVKGRIPEARDKPAKDLLDHEKTLYYERMAFVIEVPSYTSEIDGNALSLTVGGIKAYNLDNLYSKKGADEHFKVFVGFKNSVCTNLCVWTDGYLSDLKVKDAGQLRGCIKTLLENYNASYHLHALRKLTDYSLTEQQFALLIGRCRMYNHLPFTLKNEITPLLLSDTQLGAVVKDYYRDDSFCRDDNGNINLWKLYNLFTSTNKSSYIDTFLDRSVNAYRFVEDLRWALDRKDTHWFLN
jgi:hypothetical protein